MLFNATIHYILNKELLTVTGDILPAIGPLSEFTVVRDESNNMFAIRNSTIAKMDFHSEVSDAFFVETEKIIEQVTFTKKMADNKFEKDKASFRQGTFTAQSQFHH